MAGRPGITQQDVARAVSALEARGEYPSVNKIQRYLGRGSQTTVCKHLKALRSTGAKRLPGGEEQNLSYKLNLANALLKAAYELSAEWPQALNDDLVKGCRSLVHEIVEEFERAVRKHSQSNDPKSQNPAP